MTPFEPGHPVDEFLQSLLGYFWVFALVVVVGAFVRYGPGIGVLALCGGGLLTLIAWFIAAYLSLVRRR